MRNTIILLLMVSLLLCGCAETGTPTQTQFEQEAAASGFELAKDWKLLSVLAIVVSVILVAIAYMIGIGLEMPGMKAWAGNELVQVFANVIIIITLMVAIGFIDALTLGIVATSPGVLEQVPDCTTPGESCLQAVATEYLDQYVTAAEEGSKQVLKDNINAAGMASRRIGLYCLTLYCLQAGYTTTIAGNYQLDTDYYAIIFEYYMNLLSFMNAQLFFVQEIAFGMGPIVLALGVVARSFFFTRKLGGLLIAVAAGLMFFFPGMYIFDWVTLDTALTGDKGMETEEVACPAECGKGAPIAYYSGGTLDTKEGVIAAFSDGDTAYQIITGGVSSASADQGDLSGKTITSCFYGDYARCPTMCRQLPYPSSVPNCTNISSENPYYCAKLPKECKVIHYVDNINQAEYAKCPDSCKVVPPLKSDCTTTNVLCLASSYDCRMTYNDNLNWRPSKDVEDDNVKFSCNLASLCPASLTAEESCVWVIPRTGSCDDLCTDSCPEHCRIEGADITKMDATGCLQDGALKPACVSCIDSCKVRLDDIKNLSGADECGTCPYEKRVVSAGMPASYQTGDCDPTTCPLDSTHRMPIPYNTCETCLFTEESYSYKPPIQARCADLCKPSDTAPVKEAGSYMKIGEDGLVGREEIKNVSKLLLPAYILPLFNIVCTLIFIKGFSAMIGGDIEIPGISKVF